LLFGWQFIKLWYEETQGHRSTFEKDRPLWLIPLACRLGPLRPSSKPAIRPDFQSPQSDAAGVHFFSGKETVTSNALFGIAAAHSPTTWSAR
jgi:hypothetical protein